MFNTPKRFAGIKRFREILAILSRHGLDFMLEKTGLKKKGFFTKKCLSRPIEVRIMLEELGGSFVKFGQFLSLRPDLIPKEYCEELSKLQDSVDGFSYIEVEHIIKAELGKPIKSVFRSFNKVPIAAASIGQVHKAVLKNGKVVAVKVMRPGIKATFETDVEILEYLARLVKHHFDPKVFDPEEICEEFKRYTEGELDYLHEAKNIKTFYLAFKNNKEVIVPDVYEDLTTKRLLVMDFIDGVEFSRVINEPGKFKINRELLCRHLAECFLRQIFVDGVFHADPHPGNLLYIKGKIGLLDFGVIGRIDEDMKEKLGNLLISLVEKDINGIVSSLVSLDLVSSSINSSLLKEDILDELAEYYDVSLEKMDLAEIFFKCIYLARAYNIRIPRDFVLLAKCMITLKGVCAEIDPTFNIVRETRPFIRAMVAEKNKPLNVFKKVAHESRRFAMFLKDIPEQSRKFYGVLDKADLALDTINRDISVLTAEVRRESIRVILGVIISALIISASFTTAIDKRLSNFFVILAAVMLAFLFLSIFSDFFKRKSSA